MAIDLADITLRSPEWLWLLAIMLLLAYAWKKSVRNRDQVINSIDSSTPASHVYHPNARLFRERTVRPTAGGLARAGIFWLAAICLVLALAQPERIGKKRPEPLPQRDIIFIVDTSVSMTLRDYVVAGERVSRMSVVKGVLDEFVKNLQGSHLSVVVFGEHAYTYVPLTSDHAFVRSMLSRMQTTMAGRFNAIGDGVALAVKTSRRDRSATGQNQAVLILLTDADRETGRVTADNAALLAKQASLPLYTIAIGAATRSAEEARTAGLIYQPVNLDLLDTMAKVTGAKSYRAGAAHTLKQAIDDIEQRELRVVEQPPQYYRQALYHWLLYPALLLLGLQPLISILRRCRQ